eukprot:SAG22_NODE_174_length_16466_cov_34.991568_10_plen_61_part_00
MYFAAAFDRILSKNPFNSSSSASFCSRTPQGRIKYRVSQYVLPEMQKTNFLAQYMADVAY